MLEEVLKMMEKGSAKMDKSQVSSMNPLVMAYIGDTVFEVFIRTYMVVSEPNKTVHNLHVMSTQYVKAHSQSEIAHKITPMLNEEELNIIRRGRNSKSGYVPKNADVIEYRTATGFEALVGYLYLTGNTNRLLEILEYSINK